ncbi:MAG: Sir2 family NAD-dependent protein deacetylase [Gammaproteobacteria bacterium]|nr:Sir2 family NAD-dependent protein deacetylase [Gammaproteobacteria bacterium]
MTATTDADLKQFRRLLEQSERIVVFTGAGISTESGIPDFRSPGGLWSRMKPIMFDDFISSDAIRQESWRRRFSGERTLENAEPNRGHRAVAHLVDQGKALAVITQNVDNLHQRSGIPADKVIELHGNAHYATCLACGIRYELDDLRTQFETTGHVAPCSACGGIIKTATISFGQSMPEVEMRRAEEATLACDLFIAIGSSLQVYPAAGFPQVAARRGVPLVILNREETPQDHLATVVLQREIGDTLGAALGVN